MKRPPIRDERIKGGIRAKIVLVTAAIMILAIGASGTVVIGTFVRAYTKALVLEASGAAHSLKLQLDRIMRLGIDLSEIVGFDSQCEEIVKESKLITFAAVQELDGRIMFHSSPEFRQKTMSLPDRGAAAENETSVAISPDGKNYEIAVPVYGRHDELAAFVKVGFPSSAIMRQTGELWIQSLVIVAACVIISLVLLIFLVSRLVTAPLTELINAIGRVRVRGPAAISSVKAPSNDEIGELTGAFYELMDELKRSNGERERYALRLEEMVKERTNALNSANENLVAEIEERKRIEKLIKASLSEKETLLKEIHHRVKNNLQVISSFLSLQADQLPDERSRRTFADSRNRIKAMALIHESLYRSPDIAHVVFGEYVSNLVAELRRSSGESGEGIGIEIHTADACFGIDIAIHCGLIINELVSNALKYAFPGGSGTLSIRLAKTGDDGFELTVADDGIGIPPDMDIDSLNSLGLRIVKSLAEEQLNGFFRMDSGAGTRFTIRFPAERADSRGA